MTRPSHGRGSSVDGHGERIERRNGDARSNRATAVAKRVDDRATEIMEAPDFSQEVFAPSLDDSFYAEQERAAEEALRRCREASMFPNGAPDGAGAPDPELRAQSTHRGLARPGAQNARAPSRDRRALAAVAETDTSVAPIPSHVLPSRAQQVGELALAVTVALALVLFALRFLASG